MGKRIATRVRGSGRPRYRAKTHSFNPDTRYSRTLTASETTGGQVMDIVHDGRRTACLAKVLTEDMKEMYLIAPEGIQVGDWLEFGEKAPIKPGNVLPVRAVPEGTYVYNIELAEGDGGKLVKTSGAFAQVVSHERKLNLTHILLPSKKTTQVPSSVRVTVGVVSAAGRREKPLVHAGQRFYAKKARGGKLYPKVGGTSMNACDHPHGGGGHPHVGKPTTVSRNAPPGRKVGHIAARRTGKRK
ncbi:MAG: 50S ribosomal protein L2 [Candidatus Altiarchaeota archaeon]